MVMKILSNFCRLLLGAVLIFSGFSKALDPLGSTYKFADYFQAFHMDFMAPYALPMAILMNGAEFMIGVALLTNTWMNFTSWLGLLFMSFFTLLTFILALFNPVSDCGCFGDAITLSNWQTFEKNIVLIAITIVIFIYHGKFVSPLNGWGNFMIVLVSAGCFLIFTKYCYEHLPVIDFRAFKTGTYLPSQMVIPEGAPRDSFQTLLYYKKDGVVKEFNLENFPWQDTTWKWVKTDSKLIKEGYKPPIHDFTIVSKTDEDITQSVLSDTAFSFIAAILKFEQADSAGLRKVEEVYNWCKNTGVCKFYALTSSTSDTVQQYSQKYKLTFETYTTDATPLKTMVRSNPGLLLLKQGTVMGIWAYRDIPKLNEKSKNMYGVIGDMYRKKIEMLTTLSMFLILSFVLLIVFKFYNKNKQDV
jgi:uncharacterized membrane protein YphA (DoxX/SURF4 family)